MPTLPVALSPLRPLFFRQLGPAFASWCFMIAKALLGTTTNNIYNNSTNNGPEISIPLLSLPPLPAIQFVNVPLSKPLGPTIGSCPTTGQTVDKLAHFSSRPPGDPLVGSSAGGAVLSHRVHGKRPLCPLDAYSIVASSCRNASQVPKWFCNCCLVLLPLSEQIIHLETTPWSARLALADG